MRLVFPQYFKEKHIIPGPVRVFPGRLSVSRTFGDVEAKKLEYGGMPNLVIAEPEIRSIKLTPELDWILLGCDGIFDKMSNEKVAHVVWETVKAEANPGVSIHQVVIMAAEAVMHEAMRQLTLDNITVVLIALDGLKNFIEERTVMELEETNANPKRQADLSSTLTKFKLRENQRESSAKARKHSADLEKAESKMGSLNSQLHLQERKMSENIIQTIRPGANGLRITTQHLQKLSYSLENKS